MNEELVRLSTYSQLPSGTSRRLCPSRLSRLGFYFDASTGSLVCHRCRFLADFRSTNDDERELHRRHHEQSPLCRDSPDMLDVVGSYDVTGSRGPMTDTVDAVQSPTIANPQTMHIQRDRSVDRSHPDFAVLRSSESVRLSTFYDWPQSAGRIVSPGDLAAAGLFYTGHADRVQCASCRGCLRNWQQGDRAMDEHRRHFPDCPRMRGTAADAGVQGVVAADGATSRAVPPDSTANLVPKGVVSVRKDADGSTNQQQDGGDITDDTASDCADELEENRRLREARTCKVCMDSEVNTVFLPCGHLVCCDTCSPALRHCAVCRAIIRGTVKVFLG